ncbi:hypothetical protein QVD17_16772 [Tagetes erecta]|uniref:Peptidase C14 caspase domain-containing protein n=1 Tax=Tagetes erecta TaxID=13708 RepID=A0AAD8P0U0_TARER|nr:hypothetical protein QVD17_16772 [Tagetes erecta]
MPNNPDQDAHVTIRYLSNTPMCHTANFFSNKINGHVLFRVEQLINASPNLYHREIPTQPFIALPQQLPQWRHQRVHKQLPYSLARKKAVLCGITYNGHRKKLKASVHNVRSMHQLLVNKLGFSNASILIQKWMLKMNSVMLDAEEELDRSRIPTKRNIQVALQWLIQGCQAGDSLFFYYAGHGCQVPDEDGDEVDGYDEALCPLDYRVAGVVLDDEINATIVEPLPYGVTLLPKIVYDEQN